MHIPKQMQEPSTMAGGAAVMAGLNDMFQVADPQLLDAGMAAASTLLFNPTPVGLAMAAFGLFSIFMKEKGDGQAKP